MNEDRTGHDLVLGPVSDPVAELAELNALRSLCGRPPLTDAEALYMFPELAKPVVRPNWIREGF